MVPPPGGVPGGGPGPGTPGPTTGGRAAASDATSWQVWWEFNKDPFLQRRPLDARHLVSGSDEFYLGAQRHPRARDTLRPGLRDRRDRIVPALAAALQGERSRDLATACLVALAKVGLDAPPAVDLEAVFAGLLDRDDQEVRETAALAFGIAGRSRSLDRLAALLRDTPDGRRLLDKAEVNDRTRAFAAWSLGMLAARAAEPGVRQRIHDLLAPVLLGDRDDDRDLRVAAVTSLGLLRPDREIAADKRLAWQTVEELWQFYGRDIGKADQVVQAHVPTAVARLLGRGNSSLHQRAKRLLAGELSGRERRHNTILQSAALALGQMCLPAEQEVEDAGCAHALLRTWRDAADQQTRFFAVLSLGRIGGDANRDALLKLYRDANTGTERPWVALALGLIAHGRAQAGTVDETVARLLLDDVRATENTDSRAGFAVALGLTGYKDASLHVLRLLHEHEREDVLAGYLCTSLALLGDDSVVPQLTELLRRSVRRPFLLQQAAVALGRLGDEEAVPLLLDMLGQHTSTAALSAIASALALIGDRRSIDALAAMLADEEHTQLARAFAAAALGGVGDKDVLPWNAILCADVNYRADVDTLTNGKSGVLDIL